MNKCAYSKCNCAVQEASDFCSEFCYSTSEVKECNCNHSDCKSPVDLANYRIRTPRSAGTTRTALSLYRKY